MAILSISSSLRNIFNILRGLVESSGRMFTPGVLVRLNLFDHTRLSQLALDPPCPGLLPAPTPWPWTELAAVPLPSPCVRIFLPVCSLSYSPSSCSNMFMCWRSRWSVAIFVWWTSLFWCWWQKNKWWRLGNNWLQQCYYWLCVVVGYVCWRMRWCSLLGQGM